MDDLSAVRPASEALVLKLHGELRQDVHDLYGLLSTVREEMVTQEQCKERQKELMPRRQLAWVSGALGAFAVVMAFVGDIVGLASRAAGLLGIKLGG